MTGGLKFVKSRDTLLKENHPNPRISTPSPQSTTSPIMITTMIIFHFDENLDFCGLTGRRGGNDGEAEQAAEKRVPAQPDLLPVRRIVHRI
jgi:hypothetical protein